MADLCHLLSCRSLKCKGEMFNYNITVGLRFEVRSIALEIDGKEFRFPYKKLALKNGTLTNEFILQSDGLKALFSGDKPQSNRAVYQTLLSRINETMPNHSNTESSVKKRPISSVTTPKLANIPGSQINDKRYLPVSPLNQSSPILYKDKEIITKPQLPSQPQSKRTKMDDSKHENHSFWAKSSSKSPVATVKNAIVFKDNRGVPSLSSPMKGIRNNQTTHDPLPPSLEIINLKNDKQTANQPSNRVASINNNNNPMDISNPSTSTSSSLQLHPIFPPLPPLTQSHVKATPAPPLSPTGMGSSSLYGLGLEGRVFSSSLQDKDTRRSGVQSYYPKLDLSSHNAKPLHLNSYNNNNNKYASNSSSYGYKRYNLHASDLSTSRLFEEDQDEVQHTPSTSTSRSGVSGNTTASSSSSLLLAWTRSSLVHPDEPTWSAGRAGGVSLGTRAASRVRTDPHGLVNIGNTCYIAAVIQVDSPYHFYLHTSIYPMDSQTKEGVQGPYTFREIALRSLPGLVADFHAPLWRALSDHSFLDGSGEGGTGIAIRGDGDDDNKENRKDEHNRFVQLRTNMNSGSSCFEEISKLLDPLHRDQSDVKPLKSAIETLIPGFRGYRQQDAHEFLWELIDTIDTEMTARLTKATLMARKGLISPEKTDPLFSLHADRHSDKHDCQRKDTMGDCLRDDLFDSHVLPSRRRLHAEVCTVLRCENCGHERVLKEFFRDFSLDLIKDTPRPVPSPNTTDISQTASSTGDKSGTLVTSSLNSSSVLELPELFSRFFNCEMRSLKCEKCESGNGLVQAKPYLSCLPDVLTLHLKRFVKSGAEHVKNSSPVRFPKIFELDPSYLWGDNDRHPSSKSDDEGNCGQSTDDSDNGEVSRGMKQLQLPDLGADLCKIPEGLDYLISSATKAATKEVLLSPQTSKGRGVSSLPTTIESAKSSVATGEGSDRYVFPQVLSPVHTNELSNRDDWSYISPPSSQALPVNKPLVPPAIADLSQMAEVAMSQGSMNDEEYLQVQQAISLSLTGGDGLQSPHEMGVKERRRLWACVACTYENKGQAVSCEMCESPAPAAQTLSLARTGHNTSSISNGWDSLVGSLGSDSMTYNDVADQSTTVTDPETSLLTISQDGDHKDLLESRPSNSGYKYVLRAVIRHLGSSIHSGHYLCDRIILENNQKPSSHQNHPSGTHEDVGGAWNRCDDGRVFQLSEAEMLREQSTPYIFFYTLVR